MDEFIVVHENGEERIVNLAWVEEIRPDDGRAFFYYAFQGAGYMEQDSIKTDEPYNAVKRMIWR